MMENEITKNTQESEHNMFNPEDQSLMSLNAEEKRWARELVENEFYYRRELLDTLKDPRRDLYEDCGYKHTWELTPEIFLDLYQRHPFATRVVNLPVRDSWKKQPKVNEVRPDDVDENFESEFDEVWRETDKNLRSTLKPSYYHSEEGSPIWNFLNRGDEMSRIGQYGVVLLEFDDVTNDVEKQWSDPAPGFEEFDTESQYFVENVDDEEEDEEPVDELEDEGNETEEDLDEVDESEDEEVSGDRVKLIGIRVFDQVHAEIERWDEDENSPTFGRPILYRLRLRDNEDVSSKTTVEGTREREITVHWSRIIHLCEDKKNSEFLATPACRPVVNDLQDIQKIYAASPEGYWKNAFPGLSFESHPQLGGRVKVDSEGIKSQMQRYQNTLQRYLATTGGSIKTLSGTVVDPKAHVEGRIESLCVYLGCPMRIFLGSERGELASSQDKDSWDERMIMRQDMYITPYIIVPFVDRLIQVGVLPEPKEGYTVEWPDLTSLGKQAKSEIAARITDALAKYIAGNVNEIMSPRTYLIEVWEFPEEKVDQILLDQEEYEAENEEEFEEEELPPEFGGPPKPPGFEEEDEEDEEELDPEDLEDEEGETEDDNHFPGRGRKPTSNQKTENADDCGAGSPGGKGFTKGNTCAVGKGKKKSRFDTSIMQLPVPKAAVDRIRKLRKSIKPSDKVRKAGGRWPHVTLLTGIDESKSRNIEEMMKGRKAPNIEIEDVGFFETNPDFDVVILKVKKTPGLLSLRKSLMSVTKAKPIFPDYKPHVTLGFVKKGLGRQYAESLKSNIKKFNFKPRELQISNPDAEKLGIVLNEVVVSFEFLD